MFYRSPEGGRYYIGTPFLYNGTNYTKYGATHDKFMELGFTIVNPQQRPNDKYYIVSGPDLGGYYSSTPRDLAQLKVYGIADAKRQAFERLRGTDWYVIRLLELGTTDPVASLIPTDVTFYRAAIRAYSNQLCDLIYNAQTLDELIEIESNTQWPELNESIAQYS